MLVLCHTGAQLLAGITLHVSILALNHTPHNQEAFMLRARLYKGVLTSPSRYTSLFTTLLILSLSVPITPILNVSRKFSMCIIFSTGYIKIYNINSSNEYFIQQYEFVQSTIQ